MSIVEARGQWRNTTVEILRFSSNPEAVEIEKSFGIVFPFGKPRRVDVTSGNLLVLFKNRGAREILGLSNFTILTKGLSSTGAYYIHELGLVVVLNQLHREEDKFLCLHENIHGLLYQVCPEVFNFMRAMAMKEMGSCYDGSLPVRVNCQRMGRFTRVGRMVLSDVEIDKLNAYATFDEGVACFGATEVLGRRIGLETEEELRQFHRAYIEGKRAAVTVSNFSSTQARYLLGHDFVNKVVSFWQTNGLSRREAILRVMQSPPQTLTAIASNEGALRVNIPTSPRCQI